MLLESGRWQEGLELARRALPQNPLHATQPRYLIGLAHFVAGKHAESIEFLERAHADADGPALRSYISQVLAAVLADGGRIDEAVEVFGAARSAAADTRLIELVYEMRFSQKSTVERYAAALRAAGALDTGYLRLYDDYKLSGQKIRKLMFGKSIEGSISCNERPWRQTRSSDGRVTHRGWPTVVSVGSRFDLGQGTSRVVGDALCETWPRFSATVEFCFSVFRIPDSDRRWKERGDYIMTY